MWQAWAPGPIGGPGHHGLPLPEMAQQVALFRHEDLKSFITLLASVTSISISVGASMLSKSLLSASSELPFLGETEPDADRFRRRTGSGLSSFAGVA